MKKMKQIRKELSNKMLMLILGQEISLLQYNLKEVENSLQKSENVFEALNKRIKIETKPLNWNEFLDVMFILRTHYSKKQSSVKINLDKQK